MGVEVKEGKRRGHKKGSTFHKLRKTTPVIRWLGTGLCVLQIFRGLDRRLGGIAPKAPPPRGAATGLGGGPGKGTGKAVGKGGRGKRWGRGLAPWVHDAPVNDYSARSVQNRGREKERRKILREKVGFKPVMEDTMRQVVSRTNLDQSIGDNGE